MRELLLAGVLMMAGAQAPPDWEAERTKAFELRLAGKTAEAVIVLEAAVERWPARADAHYELADALLELISLDDATPATPTMPVQRPRTQQLERAASHLRRAMALAPQYRQIAAVKLVMVHEQGDMDRSDEVEPLLRDLLAMDPGSAVWSIKLAKRLAALSRCSEGAAVLVAARTTVDANRLLLGMAMPDLLLGCDAMPLSSARPLLEAAEAIASEILTSTPDDRDAVMLHGAALTALASRLPDGPEKTAIEARSVASFERFMSLNPDRQRALRGEPPERVYDGFAYVNEFLSSGKTVEAQRLYENMRSLHVDLPEFWEAAAIHHWLRGDRDDAISAARRLMSLRPRDPEPHVQLASMYLQWATAAEATAAARDADILAGQAELDAALSLTPTHQGAMIHRSMLLRAQADIETNAVRKQTLLAEADAWRTKAEAAGRDR